LYAAADNPSGILREYWEEAKEVYVMRYGELLV